MDRRQKLGMKPKAKSLAKARPGLSAVLNGNIDVEVDFSQTRLLNEPMTENLGKIVMRPGRTVSKVTFSGTFFPFLYTSPSCVLACQNDDIIGRVGVTRVIWTFRHILKSRERIIFDQTYERSTVVQAAEAYMVQMATANAFEITEPLEMEDVSIEIQLVDVRSAQTGASVLRRADELSVHVDAGYQLPPGPGPEPTPCDCE